MSKTVFTQCVLYTEQKDAWLDDVKTFCYRPIRCLIVVHPYFTLNRGRHVLTSHVQKIYVTVSRFPSTPFKDKYPTLNERQKNETSNRQTLATKTKLALQYLLFGTAPHDRTTEYRKALAIEANKKDSWTLL